MMKEELLGIWAPSTSPWSRWTKRVLLDHAFLASNGSLNPWTGRDVSLGASSLLTPSGGDTAYRAAVRAHDTAVVVELPGERSVDVGLALAVLGFRPIPLFKAYPGIGIRSKVAVWPTVKALEDATHALREMPLAEHAPPAFLLDRNRHGGITGTGIDNRTRVVSSDFPSGTDLKTWGIARVVVIVREHQRAFARDLRTVLAGYQDSGIAIYATTVGASEEAIPTRVTRPMAASRAWDAVVNAFWGDGRQRFPATYPQRARSAKR